MAQRVIANLVHSIFDEEKFLETVNDAIADKIDYEKLAAQYVEDFDEDISEAIYDISRDFIFAFFSS